MSEVEKQDFRWTKSVPVIILITVINIVGFVSYILLHFASPEMSIFSYKIAFLGMAITGFFLYDKFVNKRIDTIEELLKGNVAVANLLGFVFIGICIVLST